MKIDTLARQYDRLGAEERFRLILAAGARGDAAEQDRLCLAAPRIRLSYGHHAPWAMAFDQLATLVYVELLEEVAKHQDAYERWCDAVEGSDDAAEGGEDADVGQHGENEDAENDPHESDTAVPVDDVQPSPSWVRMLELYYAQGFILKTKIAGWKLFCERLTLPPFALWKLLPGFDRLHRAIDLLDNRQHGPPPVFQPEGMVRWMRQVRSDGQPEPTLETLITPKRFADDLAQGLHQCVLAHGG
jgi:hypothetical protein